MARRTRLEIVHEDGSLIVVDKPPGLLTVPLARRETATSVARELEVYFRSHGKRRPFVVHRIDRDTSGLVLFAKDARTQAALKGQFERREPERRYLAIVCGRPQPDEGTWRDHLVWDGRALEQRQTSARDPRGAEAISHYRVRETFDAASLIEVRLETGKRNQIRIQAGLRGHALLGERHYVYGDGVSGGGCGEARDFPRQALHAWRLAFEHPATGRMIRCEAALPADLKALLDALRRGTAA